MKKLIMLVCIAFCLLASPVVACDVCGYTHSGCVPYIAGNADGWWNGLAITNCSADTIKCRIEYEHTFQTIIIEPRSIETLSVAPELGCYILVQATGKLYVTTMIGNTGMLQGFQIELAANGN